MCVAYAILIMASIADVCSPVVTVWLGLKTRELAKNGTRYATEDVLREGRGKGVLRVIVSLVQYVPLCPFVGGGREAGVAQSSPSSAAL